MTPSVDEPFDFKAQYSAWKRRKSDLLKSVVVHCPDCGVELGLKNHCGQCDAKFGIISKGTRADVFFQGVFNSIGGILLYLLAIGASVVFRNELNLGYAPTLVVIIVGGPFIFRGIRSEIRESMKGIVENQSLDDEPLASHHLFDLAKRIVAKEEESLYPEAARCNVEALCLCDASYQRVQPIDLVSSLKLIVDTLPTELGQAYHELICADAFCCHCFTSAPLDKALFQTGGELKIVAADCPGVVEFASWLGRACQPGSQRIGTLVGFIKECNPEASQALLLGQQ